MANVHTYLNLDINLKVRLDVEEHKKGENIYLVYVATWGRFKAVGDSIDSALTRLKQEIEKVEEYSWTTI